MLRARQRAQVASDAQGFAVFRIVVQARSAAEAFGHFRTHFRILLGDVRRGTLIGERQQQAFDQVDQEYLLKKGEFRTFDLHNLYPFLNTTNRIAVTMTFAMESGSRNCQPSFMSWSYRYRGQLARNHR